MGQGAASSGRQLGGYRETRMYPTIGLSPRVRGNLGDVGNEYSVYRSIPACAGEPLLHLGGGRPVGVYPRVCGGTDKLQRQRNLVNGLSPRVRGNRQAATATEPGERSIPACAGEPDGGHPAPFSGQVYPRVCGGTETGLTREQAIDGLSPRVRGNLAFVVAAVIRIRSIPACAGEPRPPIPPGCSSWVYPRVCGGTVAKLARHVPLSGLSPRVRGNRSQIFDRRLASGSIPACAGEPSSEAHHRQR